MPSQRIKQDLSALLADLNAPIHDEYLRDESRQAGDREVLLDETWRLVAAPGSPARRAVEHFSSFLLTAFRLRLPVAASPGGQCAIEFAKDNAAFPSDGEAYGLDVTPAGITIRAGSEPGFWQAIIYLEKRMIFVRAPIVPCMSLRNEPVLSPRIGRSFLKPIADDLYPSFDPYPEEFLCRLAHYSVNGLWLIASLRELVPSRVFEGFGAESDRILKMISQLIERSARYGMKVYFWMHEPRGFPEGHAFWKKYPGVKGAAAPGWPPGSHDDYALCTSTPEVREFLTDSARELFRRAPGLGGLITTTASEIHSHCYSHVELCDSGIDFAGLKLPKECSCPRCRERNPSDVVAEVVNCIEQGVHSVDPKAHVIAWNWSWTMLEPDPSRRIIRGLAPGVMLMCDFERGGRVTRCGMPSAEDEYSLTYIGPSPRLTASLEVAREHGLKTAAKLQICATHENATCGYMPLPYNVHEKFEKIREFGVAAAMLSWDFGNYPSLPLEVAAWYSWSANNEEIDWLLSGIITRDYGAAHVENMIEAFRIFKRGYSHFPIHQALVARNPVNRAPGYPFPLEPTGKPMPWSFLPDDVWGDALDTWPGTYGPEGVQRCYEAVADECEKALPFLDRVESDPRLPCAGRVGVAVGRAAYHQMRSAALLMEFLLKRNALIGKVSLEELLRELRPIIEAEIAHLKIFVPYVERTPILGFHGEAMEYLYTADLIRQKIQDLERMLPGA